MSVDTIPTRVEIVYDRKTYYWTGKLGTHVATGRESAEYEAGDHSRLWAFVDDGVVNEPNA